jgi:hypothetical protein
MLLHPPFEEGADGCFRASDLQLVGIRQELRAQLLGLAIRDPVGALALALDRDAVDEHDPLTGRRVLPGGHPDLVAARTAPDAAALPRHRRVWSRSHEREASKARGPDRGPRSTPWAEK